MDNLQPHKIEDGEDLRESIVEYAKSKIHGHQLIIVLILALFVIIAADRFLNTESIWSFLGSLLIMIFVLGAILIFTIIFSDATILYNNYFKYNDVILLLENSICLLNQSFDAKNKETRFIFEIFSPSNRIKHDVKYTRKLIKVIASKLQPEITFTSLGMGSYSSSLWIAAYAIPPNNRRFKTNDLADKIEMQIERAVKKYLPEDVKNNGIEMSKVYFYIYCIENTLRHFIETESQKKFGDNYIEKLIPENLKKKIAQRKDGEKIFSHIENRGLSDLFYVDITDLAGVINTNQHLKKFFPDENWIRVYFKQIAEIRNLTAHNSSVGKESLENLNLHFKSILTYIEKANTNG